MYRTRLCLTPNRPFYVKMVLQSYWYGPCLPAVFATRRRRNDANDQSSRGLCLPVVRVRDRRSSSGGRAGFQGGLCRTGHHAGDRHGSAGRVRQGVSPRRCTMPCKVRAAVFDDGSIARGGGRDRCLVHPAADGAGDPAGNPAAVRDRAGSGADRRVPFARGGADGLLLAGRVRRRVAAGQVAGLREDGDRASRVPGPRAARDRRGGGRRRRGQGRSPLLRPGSAGTSRRRSIGGSACATASR